MWHNWFMRKNHGKPVGKAHAENNLRGGQRREAPLVCPQRQEDRLQLLPQQL